MLLLADKFVNTIFYKIIAIIQFKNTTFFLTSDQFGFGFEFASLCFALFQFVFPEYFFLF